MSDLIVYVLMAAVVAWAIAYNDHYDSPNAVAKRRRKEIQRELKRGGRRG
jgi:hypothetical protein